MKKLMILAAVSLACACNGADPGNFFDLSGVDLTGNTSDFTAPADLTPPIREILVTDDGFKDELAIVPPGTTVVWKWKEGNSGSHSVISGEVEKKLLPPIFYPVPDGEFCSTTKPGEEPSKSACFIGVKLDELKDVTDIPGGLAKIVGGQSSGEYRRKFDRPGEYKYFCAKHSLGPRIKFTPHMGTLIVGVVPK